MSVCVCVCVCERERERERDDLIYQASIIHGNACSKHCHIAVKEQFSSCLHSCVEQGDSPSPVPDEVVSTLKDGGESKCSYSTSIFIVFQRSIVFK